MVWPENFIRFSRTHRFAAPPLLLYVSRGWRVGLCVGLCVSGFVPLGLCIGLPEHTTVCCGNSSPSSFCKVLPFLIFVILIILILANETGFCV